MPEQDATFFRDQFNSLVISLVSNEILGTLDTDYIEDYDGTDSQLSLYHHESSQRFPVLMAEDVGNEVSPHEAFIGYASLASLPDGTYDIQGRVRDLAGNYTILSDYSAPLGTETIYLLRIFLQGGAAHLTDIQFGPLVMRGSFSVPLTSDATVHAVYGGTTITLDVTRMEIFLRGSDASPNIRV